MGSSPEDISYNYKMQQEKEDVKSFFNESR